MFRKAPVHVLRLDGSALLSETDLALAVSEIYRRWRSGHRVLAIVSALGPAPDDLLKRAQQLGLPPRPQGVAVLLTLALERAGLTATLLDPLPTHLLASIDPFAPELCAGMINGVETAVVVVPGPPDRLDGGPACPRLPRPLGPPLRVALLGCGTVGGGVLAHLMARPTQFRLTGVAVRDRQRDRIPPVPRHLLTDDPAALVERGADVVIELLGGLEPAGELIARALDLGRHVITANKAVLARHLDDYTALAGRRGVSLRFSASVGGALPALEAVRRAAASGRVRAISGVLNGTCSFVLDRCAAGDSFAAAVEKARQAGYAEADPTLDVDGSDAAQKVALLAREAFGQLLPWESIERRGIADLDAGAVASAARQGRVTRLVASCERSARGLKASVQPLELPAGHPFARVSGAGNALGIELENGEHLALTARGAGRWPTSEAVLADLLDLAAEPARLAEELVLREGAA